MPYGYYLRRSMQFHYVIKYSLYLQEFLPLNMLNNVFSGDLEITYSKKRKKKKTSEWAALFSPSFSQQMV